MQFLQTPAENLGDIYYTSFSKNLLSIDPLFKVCQLTLLGGDGVWEDGIKLEECQIR